MDIDLSSIIMGIAFLSTFFVPIAWYQLSEKKKKSRAEHALTGAAQEANLNLSHHDTWAGKYGIGLDVEKQVLIWLHLSESADINKTVTVNLHEAARCTMKVSERIIKGLKGAAPVTESIALHIAYRSSSKKPVILEFFNATSGTTQSTEHALSKKWARMIGEQLKQFEKAA
jgi:hypothetical protein